VWSTSGNEHEPIAWTPQDAPTTILKTRMDLLVVGDTSLAQG
jgi:predicted NodU family carbamoyl transferase